MNDEQQSEQSPSVNHEADDSAYLLPAEWFFVEHAPKCPACDLPMPYHEGDDDRKVIEPILFRWIRFVRRGRAIPQGWWVVRKRKHGFVVAAPEVVEVNSLEEYVEHCPFSSAIVRFGNQMLAATASSIELAEDLRSDGFWDGLS
jgi:hypothetical protein